MRTARLRKPLERTLRAGHPWVYADALDARGEPGDVVTVVDARGAFVARGIADAGAIGVRVWATRDEPLDAGLLRARLLQASELRTRVVPPNTDAYRLVHGEGDRMPGLVVDVYGDHAVMRLDGEGATAWRAAFEDALRPVLEARGVSTLLVRTGRRHETQVTAAWGALPETPRVVLEHGMKLLADLVHGQKTGLFLDHRTARRTVRGLAKGGRVLNLYGYTGGFSVAAGLGGAKHVVTVDIAPSAIALAERTWTENALPDGMHEAIACDVPEYLADAARRGLRFDVIVADPPSFAPSDEAVPQALRSYRALHANCLKLLAPGGIYLAASCSSHVDMALFEGTLRDATERSGRVLQLLERAGAPADHPRLEAFPEGDYLKTVVLRDAS